MNCSASHFEFNFYIGFISISLCSIICILIQETIQWPSSNALKFHLFFAPLFGRYEKHGISRRMSKVWSSLQKCKKRPIISQQATIRDPVFISIAVDCVNDKNVHSFRLFFFSVVSFRLVWICVFIFCFIRGGRNSSHSRENNNNHNKTRPIEMKKSHNVNFISKRSFIHMGYTYNIVYMVDPRYIAIRINKYTQSRY